MGQHPGLDSTSWRERLLLAALFVGLAPVILPLLTWDSVSFRWRLWRYLRGSTEEAWQRCARLWSDCRCVYGQEVGPSMITPFEHALAERFARQHPDARAFLLERLLDADPYLAAYAFKCLIRFDGICREDIPEAVLARSEEIKALRWGCLMETMPLGQYFCEYFDFHLRRGLSS
ncbi:MAG: hypothetical protein AB7K24_05175 [Gemmataceae bacterium]